MQASREHWVHGLGIAILLLVNVAGNPIPDGVGPGRYALIMLLLALLIAGQWLGIVQSVRWSWRRYPSPARVKPRLAYSFVLSVGWVAPWMIVADFLMQHVLQQSGYHFTYGLLATCLLNAFILCFTVIGATEALYYHTRLRQTELEKADLQRINLLTRYDSLRQQVNPHFLFNSLNTLSSLIISDPEQAERFVQEMSQVYRYLLQSNREELAPLWKELEFIGSYLHLLTTRFGPALRVTLDVPADSRMLQLPPLTLQMLVENAVKHNEVSSENPLHIGIAVIEGGRLLVSNNLQKKLAPVHSERVGLANIMARYRLLGLPEVEVSETDREFLVSLPLIGPGAPVGSILQANTHSL